MPPTITALERLLTAVVGSGVTLTCTATGDPFPILTWTRNGVEIDGLNGQFALGSNGAVLMVQSVGVEDEGEFQCHASNVAGTAVDTVNLNVIGTALD